MNDSCTEMSEKHLVAVSFLGAGTGSDLANLYCEACIEGDDSIAVDQLAADIIDELDVVKLVSDGTLTSASRGFWQFSNNWSKVLANIRNEGRGVFTQRSSGNTEADE